LFVCVKLVEPVMLTPVIFSRNDPLLVSVTVLVAEPTTSPKLTFAGLSVTAGPNVIDCPAASLT
jgi:hypothetical protein